MTVGLLFLLLYSDCDIPQWLLSLDFPFFFPFHGHTQSYFGAQFKKATGMSAGGYQNHYGQQN